MNDYLEMKSRLADLVQVRLGDRTVSVLREDAPALAKAYEKACEKIRRATEMNARLMAKIEAQRHKNKFERISLRQQWLKSR